MVTASEVKIMSTIAQRTGHHGSGQLTVGTSAKAITQIVKSTGASTIYSINSVLDGAAWDLSDVEVGDVVKTADGYRGVVTDVDDASDTLSIAGGWMSPSGRAPNVNSSRKPTDTNAATVYRVNRCKRIKINADAGNGISIFVRHGGSAPGAGVYTDYPLPAGVSLSLEAEHEYIDLTTVWVIAAGAATANWIIGGVN